MEMYEALWAKKQDKNGRMEWLPLDIHLEDTMNIAGGLWEHWLCEGQRRIVADSMGRSVEEAKKVALFLGRIHDIGKSAANFQVKTGYYNSPDLDSILIERLENTGLEGLSKLELPAPMKTPHALAGEVILEWLGVNQDIGAIVGAHHGKPIDSEVDCYNQGVYKENYYQSEKGNPELYKKWYSLHRYFFKKALDESGIGDVENLLRISQKGQVILLGLLVMADWIASNEFYFPLIAIEEWTIPDYEKRIEMGWSRWKRTEQWRINLLPRSASEYYDLRFNFDDGVKSFQAKVYDEIRKLQNPGLVIIEAPMGCGKTEVALAAVEQLAYQTNRSGMFFALPTQATSNGIFPRIESWMEKAIAGTEGNVSLRLLHGKAELNEDFRKIPNASNMDEDEEGMIVVNSWFNGRKLSVLDDFVVGTVDQILYLALKQKYLYLRHLGMTKKVVVIDELHSYDSYMNEYLFRVLEWLGAYQVPVVLLSATLPVKTRNKCIQKYLSGRGLAERKFEKLKLVDSFEYPLLTMTDETNVIQYKDFRMEKHQSITIHRLDEEKEFCAIVEEMFKEKGIIGIIVNTVKKAQKITEEFSKKFGEEEVVLLHSHFIDSHRVKKEKELLALIGKGQKRPDRKIIIGTQVLEQSLDIDFDVLITDLCPMDLLIQRIGRLHRHENERRMFFENPKVYVLGTSDEWEFDTGSKAIYGEYLLARTQYFLGTEMKLPGDISPLVQRVYGESELCLEGERKKKYQEFYNDFKQKQENKENKARAFRLDSPTYGKRGTLIGWLKRTNENSSEEYAYAQVRDVEETLEVIALKETEEGYGCFQERNSENIISRMEAREIGKETIRLNASVLYRIGTDEFIKRLERETRKCFPEWGNDSWLKGRLAMVFDEDGEYALGEWKLIYDLKYGLILKEKEGNENGKI